MKKTDMVNIDKLNWITRVEDAKYEMVLDHHMLSTWRSCQAAFQHLHIEGRRPKSGYSWSLEFGLLLHRIIEDIYAWRQDGTFSHEKLTHEAYHMWDEANMDRFKDHRTCKSLGGKMGFIALAQCYAQYYNQDSERLRIIGTEIAFGRNKEVPLGSIKVQKSSYELIDVDCYLSGRIDFLADNGNKIGPVDHKTRANFGTQDLGAAYNPHEGMTGYIYATRNILKEHFPELAATRQANTAWMNFIQVGHETDPLKRFRRVLVMRTDYQLEQFRLRQLQVFKDIFNYLFHNSMPLWNTEMCAHWYGTDCMYHAAHRQPDAASQLIVLNNDFTSGDYWNPEDTGVKNGRAMSGNNSTESPTVQEQGV